jgi:long-chain acyl-CoA synthetase
VTVGEHNLARLAEQAFERHGDYESTYFEGAWLRSGDLFERSRRLAGGFAELGVAPGDRVVVMMANSPEVGLCYTALWRAGAVITPAIFLLPPDELRHVLSDSEARAIVTTPEFLGTVRAAAEGVSTLKFILVLGSEEEGVIPLESLESASPIEIVARGDDDLAALMYTGGTTGRAKGVMLSHENLWYCGKASEESSYIPGMNRTLVPLPLAHAFGLIVTIVGAHAREPGKSALMRWFDPAGFLTLIQDLEIQRSPLVPSMIQILLTQPLEEYDLSTWRYVNSGASPLPLDAVRELERRVPNVQVLEGYGCTESGAVISVNPPGARKLGTVGKALPGYEVRLDADGDDELEEGLGEVLVRSRGVMQGYWKAPEATESTLRDGWLHTGDIGRMDEDGYLSIVDRKKDLIIRGGFNVFPRDVEDAIVEHPAVALCGVVGRPDDKYGEEVVAFVQLAPGAQVGEEDLVAFGKQRLGGYKYPREVKVVDAVPLTPVGKIDRKRLRTML